VQCIGVVRLFAPGAHFLSIAVTYWIVLFVAYRFVHVIAYCLVFLIVYRLGVTFMYNLVFTSEFLKVACIVTLRLISFLDHRVSYQSYDLQLWMGSLGIRRSQGLSRRHSLHP